MQRLRISVWASVTLTMHHLRTQQINLLGHKRKVGTLWSDGALVWFLPGDSIPALVCQFSIAQKETLSKTSLFAQTSVA